MTTAQLNAVANLLEANGIEVTKELVFTVCIKTLVENGLPVREAIDTVLGEGRYQELASTIYDNLTAA